MPCLQFRMSDKAFLDLSQFERLEKIGKGQFGAVYKVKCKKTNEILASKISLKELEIEEDEEGPRSLIRNLVREVNIMSKLNHPSIVKFIGFRRNNFSGDPKPVIITELMTGGSLGTLIESERNGISNDKWNPTRKLITLYGVASAMLYLHSHNIIHRDLKPDNILMDNQLYPKIADFGLSKILHRNEDSLSAVSTGGFKGTFLYSSPEVLIDAEYTPAGDVYSFGIIAYEVITNDEPFKNCSFTELLIKVTNGTRPPFECEIPNSYKNLIERCWAQEQSDRPTFEQIVDEMKNDNGFITDLIDEADFINYVDYIDDCQISFEKGKKIVSIDEFIKRKKEESDDSDDEHVVHIGF